MSSARVKPFGPGDFELAQGADLPPLGPAVITKWQQSRCYQPALSEEEQAQLLDYFLKSMMVGPTAVALTDAGRFSGKVVTWIPGHIVGDRQSYGPMPASIMIVGKFPTREEARERRLWVGAAGKLLARELSAQEIDLTACYGTQAVKFHPPYPNMRSVPAAWASECRWFLRQELELVRPKFLLILGADALKAVMGSKAKMRLYRGTSFEAFGAQAVVAGNPADLVRNPEAMDNFLQDIAVFGRLVRGASREAKPVDYRYLRNEQQLKEAVDQCLGHTEFALDCEWSGDNHTEGRLLTIQFSCQERQAFVVVLRSDVQGTEFEPSCSAAIVQLRRLLDRPEVSLIGHNLRADLKFLSAVGLELGKLFASNGFDTMLAHHLIRENAEHNLTSCSLLDTDMERYDTELEQYLAKGYTHGTVPESVLLPYAAGDADATFRLYKRYGKILWDEHCRLCQELNQDPERAARPLEAGKPWVPSTYNLFRQIVMAATGPIHEMEMVGILADPARVLEMAKLFAARRDGLLAELRAVTHEPDFNPRSNKHVARLLFGRPGSECRDGRVHTQLGLTPIKATGKRPKMWDRCVEDREVYYLEEPVWEVRDGKEVMVKEAGWNSNFHFPGTDGETLAVLAEDRGCKEAELLRNFRFLDQICKNFLSMPEVINGDQVFTSGLGGAIRRDGRIHTTFSQLTETGRYRSSDPNCFWAKTDLLTERGWLPVSEIYRLAKKGVRLKLAQYNLKTGSVTFRRPLGYIRKKAKQLLRLASRGIQLTVTPDHDCWIRDQEGAFQCVKAEEYTGSPRLSQQVQAGIYRGGRTRLSDPMVILLASVQADATLTKSGAIVWDFVYQRKIRRLRKALREVGFRYRECHYRNFTRFYLPHQKGSDYLRSWKFFDCRILKFDQHTLARLSQEVCRWDGMESRQQYYSTVKANSDWVQIVHTLAGRRSSMTSFRVAKDRKRVWRVVAGHQDYSIVGTVHKRRLPARKGTWDTYCVKMPQGTVITRDRGRVAVTGQCQNLPKGREGDLAKLFRGDEVPPVRTCLMADPAHVLVEADLESAELYTLAAVAGDREMSKDLERRDSAGRKISFHSVQAVNIFQLKMTPEEFDQRRKKGGAEAKKLEGLRIGAKSVNFGIPYQRGPQAIARQVQREGVECSSKDAQKWIDAFYDRYKDVARFLQSCKDSVYDPGWLRTPFGRVRHFHHGADEAAMAAQEREACNFPIQSTVADAVSLALAMVQAERDRRDLKFQIVLQVHDAIMLSVPYAEVPAAREILRQCMSERLEVPGTGLHYGVDIEVYRRWNEKLKDVEILRACGLGQDKGD